MSLTQHSWCWITTRVLPVLKRWDLLFEFTGPLPGEGPKVLDLLDRPGDEGDICLTISQPAGVLDGVIERYQPNIPVTPILENGQGKRGRLLRIPVTTLRAATTNWPVATGVTLSLPPRPSMALISSAMRW